MIVMARAPGFPGALALSHVDVAISEKEVLACP
jgi:hypothetical protein